MSLRLGMPERASDRIRNYYPLSVKIHRISPIRADFSGKGGNKGKLSNPR